MCATGARSIPAAACCATSPRCWASRTKTSGLTWAPTPTASSTSWIYLAIGVYADAATLLARPYPSVAAPMREAGAVTPGESPLVALYRGYVRERAGQRGGADYRLRRDPADGVCLSRPAFVVPRVAVRARRRTRTTGRARYLLGALYLSSGLTEPAIEAWQRVRHLQPPIPTLHRSLGLALLHGPGDFAAARAVLEEGSVPTRPTSRSTSRSNRCSAPWAPPRPIVWRRCGVSRRRLRCPASMVFKLALALAETGEAAAAERVFHDRFFPREEGGTSVARGVCADAADLRTAGGSDRPMRRGAWRGWTRWRRSSRAWPSQPAGLAICSRSRRCLTRWPRSSGRAAGARQARARWERLAGAAVQPQPDERRDRRARCRALGRADGPAERAASRPRSPTRRARSTPAARATPALTECARGLLLQALGRDAESRRSLRRVFLFPDRNLSHVLARAALHARLPRGSQAATRSRSSR